jgi:hypothetical protein
MSIKQNFPTIDPTLNLDFANSRAVDSRIQFTRASAATHTDALGILQTLRDNKPRIDFDASTGECRGLLIEEQRTNLIVYSNDPDYSSWSLSGASIAKNVAIAPDGTMSADKIVENTATVTHGHYQMLSVSNSTLYTWSAYFKAAERTSVMVYAQSSRTPTAIYNLSTGTVTSIDTAGDTTATATITPAGNGWYRCTITATTVGTTAYHNIAMVVSGNQTYAGNGSSGLFVWGAQFEAGGFATSYIPSITTFTSRASSATYFDAAGVLRTAPVNGARYGFGYDSTTQKWISQGLVLEPAATNLIPGSNLFGNTLDAEAIWTKTNNSTDVIAPDGNALTTKMVSGTTGNTWYWKELPGGTYAANTTYTHSVWIRTASGTSGNISFSPYPYGGGGAVTVTDQWQRVTATFTTNGSGTSPYIGFVSPQASRTFYLWGWQAELGSVATSYIPTASAATTRSADVSSSVATTRAQDKPSINSANLLPLLDIYEGTVYSQGKFFGADPNYNNPTVYMNDGTASNYIALFNHASTYGWAQSSVGTQAGIVGISSSANTDYKLAFGYKANDFAFCSNGGSVGTDTSGSVPNINQMTIGYRNENQSFSYNGHIKKIVYYPQRLSNTQLQALTV